MTHTSCAPPVFLARLAKAKKLPLTALSGQSMPSDHFPCRKRKIIRATHTLVGYVNFVISFADALLPEMEKRKKIAQTQILD